MKPLLVFAAICAGIVIAGIHHIAAIAVAIVALLLVQNLYRRNIELREHIQEISESEREIQSLIDHTKRVAHECLNE